MSDNYQAVYDAVRSRFHVCDVGSAVRSAFDISGIIHLSISIDGNQWIALYGDNLQDGVAGSGDSPEEAMRNFDKAWFEKLSNREPSKPYVNSPDDWEGGLAKNH